MGPDGAVKPRFFHIDLTKAVFALLVVMVHCMRPGWDPGATRFELWHGSAVAILVTPAFLFCAGFLAAQATPMTWTAMGRRYRRLLIPYLVATALAELYRALYLGESVHPLRDLLLADAFGPYYFVFHMLLLTPVSLALTRIGKRPRRALWLLFVGTGAVRSFDLWVRAPGLDPQLGLIMLVRNPFIYWGFFMSGWEYRLAHGRVRRWLDEHRASLWAVCVVVIVAGNVEAWYTPGWHTPWLSYPLIYAVLLALSLLPCAAPGRALSGAIRWLSERTYEFYLFHLFFVLTALRLWPHPHGAFSLARFALHYGAGVLGVAAILLARDRLARLMGRMLPAT